MELIVMAAFCGFVAGASCIWCAMAHAVLYPDGRKSDEN